MSQQVRMANIWSVLFASVPEIQSILIVKRMMNESHL